MYKISNSAFSIRVLAAEEAINRPMLLVSCEQDVIHETGIFQSHNWGSMTHQGL
jgi:hypothetical protein